MKNRIEINYIYFGILFFIITILTSYNILTVKTPFTISTVFFLLYSIAQIILEIALFILIYYLAQQYLHKIGEYLVIALSCIFLLIHIIDFLLIKILDLSFWEALEFTLDENFLNFIEMLHSTGIPLFVWLLGGVISLFLPILAIIVYNLTNKPIQLPYKQFLLFTFFVPISLFLGDLVAYSNAHLPLYHLYQKILPWKYTFFHHSHETIEVANTLKKPKSEKEYLKILEKKNVNPPHSPNIYLFIIESLRADFITKETAPTLHQFKQNNISFNLSFSSANATPISWFSIFFSKYPLFWTQIQSNWKLGSLPIYILKKIGYTTHIYSSAQLKYYKMSSLLFGKNKTLADNFYFFPHYFPLKAHQADKRALQKLQKDIKEDIQKEKNLHIIFLDSTHFDYSWPDTIEAKFQPIAPKIVLLPSDEDLKLIQNRYKNAIFYVDTLFATFLKELKKNKLYKNAIIIVTSDHGEEFLEEGRLFHASHLSPMQTRVPIYYKFGNNKRKPIHNHLTSHIDIFPSILDYIFRKNEYGDLFDGHSIFDTKKLPFIMTARFNASRDPIEFFIHNGKNKLTLQFDNKKNIFNSKKLEILSIKDINNQDLPIKNHKEEFQKILDKIFIP